MNRRSEPAAQPVATDTGLPGFRTWRAVYGLILAAFAFWVAFLTLLPRLFP